jgi:hypothetical protein
MQAPLKLLVAPTAAMSVAIALVAAESAQALNFYTGLDAGIGPGVSRPESDAAASSFDTAAASLGTLNTVSFENLAVTADAAVGIAPGVTANWFNQGGNTIVDVNIQTFSQSLSLGYNTTSGGRLFAQVAYNYPDFTQPVGVTFTFASPIQAWGAYFTGIGSGDGETVIEFSDGTLQKQPIVGDRAGGVAFLGFTDPGRQISAITVVQNPVNGAAGDIFGIDDMRYVPAVPTPALIPAALGMAIALLKEKLKVKS